MQIHNNTLIAECSAYDFKEMLERKTIYYIEICQYGANS